MNDVSMANNNSDTRKPTHLIAVTAVIVAIVIAVWLLPTMQYVLVVLEYIEDLGQFGPVVVAFFYILAAVLLLPGAFLTLASGYMFGIPLGMITVWIGAGMGACSAFLVGRAFARDWVVRRIANNAKLTALDKAVGKDGFKIVFLLRLSPILPFNLLNYALGLTRVSFKDYAVASVIGMAPAEFLYVYIGSAARSLADVAAGKADGGIAGDMLFWGGLLATALVTVFVTRLAKRNLELAEASARADESETTGSSVAVETPLHVSPDDKYNRELLANVHPEDWINPKSAGTYDLIVVGGGTAGLVTAAAAAGLGAKVAIIERFLLGGDCLNVGCVPSKTIIASSRIYRQILDAERYGIASASEATVDFPAVMERMRRLRAKISHHDSAKRFKELGVDVFLGNGRFTGRDSLFVANQKLSFKKAVIATGARAAHPSIPGLAEAGFLTNETVFSLTQRPERLAVIGGGPIGCEMAQAFRRLGSQVLLLHKNSHILDREDPDAAEILQKRFIAEGIQLVLNSEITGVHVRGSEKVIRLQIDGTSDEVAVDEVLIGIGRAPNVEDLGLESAGVEYDNRSGVVVNDRLQTTNPIIYAAGDICMNYKFTHAADAAARMVVQNALFMGRKKLSALTIPWCTYTDPEIAHVGMYERDAQKTGVAVETFVRPLSEVDRAIADGEDEGFVKIHVRKGTDQIVGATIVASHAGDMISQITMAMIGKMGLKTLSGVIYPYPTQAEAVKQVADAYNRTRLTPFVKRILKTWLSWAP